MTSTLDLARQLEQAIGARHAIPEMPPIAVKPQRLELYRWPADVQAEIRTIYEGGE